VIDLSAKAYLFENTAVETFDDLFSLKNEIMPVYDYAEFEENDGEEFDTDTVLTQTDVSSRGDFDDIVGVFEPSVEILDFEDKGDKVFVVAKIKALAIYKTQNSLEKIDLGYETRFETDKDISKRLKNVKAFASVSAFKVKAGKDLESAFSVEYKFDYEKEYSEKYVKGFERTKEKTNQDAGVKVYVVKENQSVFDIAKALNVAPELITSQNEVSDYFEAGQKVYVYCPLNMC
jgi:transposase